MERADWPAVLGIARGLAAWFSPVEQMTLAIDLRAHAGLVLSEQGRIRAFLSYHLLEPGRAELSWLGTDAGAHGHGYGSALLAALEAQLRAQGVHTLQLSTMPADYNPTFTQTNHFYLHRGFSVTGRDANFYGPGRPRLLLEKALAAEA